MLDLSYKDDARKFLESMTDSKFHGNVDKMVKAAKMKAHPDRGGSNEKFAEVLRAENTLKGNGPSQSPKNSRVRPKHKYQGPNHERKYYYGESSRVSQEDMREAVKMYRNPKQDCWEFNGQKYRNVEDCYRAFQAYQRYNSSASGNMSDEFNKSAGMDDERKRMRQQQAEYRAERQRAKKEREEQVKNYRKERDKRIKNYRKERDARMKQFRKERDERMKKHKKERNERLNQYRAEQKAQEKAKKTVEDIVDAIVDDMFNTTKDTKGESKVKYSKKGSDYSMHNEYGRDEYNIFDTDDEKNKTSKIEITLNWLKKMLVLFLSWVKCKKDKEGVKELLSFENVILFCGLACILITISAAIIAGIFFLVLLV